MVVFPEPRNPVTIVMGIGMVDWVLGVVVALLRSAVAGSWRGSPGVGALISYLGLEMGMIKDILS